MQHAAFVRPCLGAYVAKPVMGESSSDSIHEMLQSLTPNVLQWLTCFGHCMSASFPNGLLQVTGFGYEHDEPWAANIELFKYFTDNTQGVRRLGAAAIDLCHVALGKPQSLEAWERI